MVVTWRTDKLERSFSDPNKKKKKKSRLIKKPMICFNPLEKDDATETTTTLEFRHRYMQAKIGPKHLLRVMPNQKPWKPAGRLN